MPARLGVIRAKELTHQGTDELRTLFGPRLGNERVLKSLGIPTRFEVTPAATTARAFAERGKEPPVTHLLTQVLGVAEQSFSEVHAGDRSIRMCPPYEIDVAAQDTRLHVMSADHVVRHQQELLAPEPLVVLGDDGGQFRDAACGWIALQDQMQHSHEVAFSTPEAAVQIAGLAGVRLQGAT